MDAAISLDTVVVAAKDQASCSLEDEIAIVHLKTGVYYGLDSVGARVWELLKTPRSVAAVRDVLLAEYEVDAARCESDLVTLLQTMAEAGLVEVSDGEPR
jgi:Coenzyme PQQ synthesis protein D (PqqD)